VSKPRVKQVQRIRTGQVVSQSQPIEPLAVRVPAAAAMIDVSENMFWGLIRDGEVRVSRHGNVTLVHTDSLREYLQRHTDRRPDIRGPREHREKAAAARIAASSATSSAPVSANDADTGDANEADRQVAAHIDQRTRL